MGIALGPTPGVPRRPTLEEIDLVLYHGRCLDGLAAAWALFRGKKEGVEYVPCFYQTDPPDVTGRNVAVVDFSYPRDAMRHMINTARSIVVIDHHKTAEADLAGLRCTIFNADHSGAGLAWRWAHPDTPPPLVIDYIEDRDLWRWALPGSKALNAALRSYPWTFETLTALADLRSYGRLRSYVCRLLGVKTWDALLEEGRAIQRYQDGVYAEYAARATPVVFGSATPCVMYAVVCSSKALISGIGHAICSRYPGAAALIWSYDPTTEMVGLSFRSTDTGPDVSVYAKENGGGGHRNAAGCRVSGDTLQHLVNFHLPDTP